MIRLFCLLSGVPDEPKVRHYSVPVGGKFDEKQEMHGTKFLVIEATAEKSNTGALLYRFDNYGICVGESWHQSIDEAKGQAVYEYEGLLGEWKNIPSDVKDAAIFGTHQLRQER